MCALAQQHHAPMAVSPKVDKQNPMSTVEVDSDGQRSSISGSSDTTGESVPGATMSSHGLAAGDPVSVVPQSLDTHGRHGHVAGERGPTTHRETVLAADAAHLDPASGLHLNGNSRSAQDKEHVIRLSSIEHCMPRAYIRICFAYRLPTPDVLPDAVRKLNDFVRRTVDAKPYLSGWVVAAKRPGSRVDRVDIRFSDHDFLHYPGVGVRHLTRHEVPYTYDELDRMGLPPSVIKPGLMSELGESADEEEAPVFRVQANVVQGGLIVSVYLHHCVSDGTGIGSLVSGSLLNDDLAFDRFPDGGEGNTTPGLSLRLQAFADRKSALRQALSHSSADQVRNRHLECKTVGGGGPHVHLEHESGSLKQVAKPPGRGCVMAVSLAALTALKDSLDGHAGPESLTSNDVLHALIWSSMTRARCMSVPSDVTSSKLLIPVNIRNRLATPLPDAYFGAAVDFACAEAPFATLTDAAPAALAHTAQIIRKAITDVDEPYIRQAIALARSAHTTYDVRDLQASNMDRARGADMYITSWEKLPCYDATFDMGLGGPDWIRKPWSKDPGSCIVLPRDHSKAYLEVVIQMTEIDMDRLLADDLFARHLVRVID